MKRLIIDLDDTISFNIANDYSKASPNKQVINRLKEFKLKGFSIAIYTARNMRTYEGNIGRINANTLPVIIEWLNQHDVPYDEIYTGKPWCGFEGFYVNSAGLIALSST